MLPCCCCVAGAEISAGARERVEGHSYLRHICCSFPLRTRTLAGEEGEGVGPASIGAGEVVVLQGVV